MDESYFGRRVDQNSVIVPIRNNHLSTIVLSFAVYRPQGPRLSATVAEPLLLRIGLAQRV